MQKSLFTTLVLAMALVVVVSNILVQFLLGDWLTWAAFTYPVAFLITDLANRILGPDKAKKIVIYGFVTGIVCSFVASQLTNADGIPYSTIRIALGSGAAFLAAQLTDVFIFTKLKHLAWWKAPVLSSVFGSVLDTAIFFTVAFSSTLIFVSPSTDVSWANDMIPVLGFGTMAPLWVSLAVADFAVKMSVAVVALVPFRLITTKVQLS